MPQICSSCGVKSIKTRDHSPRRTRFVSLFEKLLSEVLKDLLTHGTRSLDDFQGV